MVTYLSSYFSPNMVMKSAIISFERISVPEFVAEVTAAAQRGDLINIVQYRDTLELVRKLTGLDVPVKTLDVRLRPNDTILLVTIKNRKKFKDVWEAFKKNRVLFWRVKIEVM